MRKNAMGIRVLSLLLALVMVLSLCGCRKDETARPTMETNENGEISITDQERATRPAEGPVAQMHNDDTIAAHIAHNAEVNPTPVPERDAEEFHIYVTNNETMLGFVNTSKITDYVNGLQSALKAAHDMYGNLYSHSMTGAQWNGAEALDDRKLQTHTFYYGNELPAEGALASLFRQGDNPFPENALSVVVSNFVEPGFDLTSLSDGIKEYFDSYVRSGACVIGFTSYFEGNFHIPQIGASGDRTTFCIQDFKGEVPYYMVVVGPQEAVNQYTERLFKYLDNQKVKYSYEHFSNNIYEEHFAQPLVFDLVSDIKAQKLPIGTPFSYNTGAMTEHEAGNAYFTTYSSVETRDGAERKKVRGETEPTVPEDAVKIANSSQIALLSRNYDGVSSFQYETALYIYNKDTQTWQDAGKNAQLMVNATLTPVSGEWKVPVVDKEYVFLTSNREEMYASVQLDFGTDDILSRDEVYRLEMKIHLNQEQGRKTSEVYGTGLDDYYIDNNAYYSLRDHLNRGRLLSGDYRWTALFQTERDPVLNAVVKTPNLEALLISLREMEDDYKTYTEMYTYLDFVFNIREKGSSGRRG